MDDFSGYRELATEMCVRAATDAITAKMFMEKDRNDPMLADMPKKFDYVTAKQLAPIAYAQCMDFLKEKCELYSGVTVEAMMEKAEKTWPERSGRLDKWNFWTTDDRKIYSKCRNTAIKSRIRMTHALIQANKVINRYVDKKVEKYQAAMTDTIIAEYSAKKGELMKVKQLYKHIPDHRITEIKISCEQTDFGTWCATATEVGQPEELYAVYSDTWADAMMKLAAKMDQTAEELEDYTKELRKEIKRSI